MWLNMLYIALTYENINIPNFKTYIVQGFQRRQSEQTLLKEKKKELTAVKRGKLPKTETCS